eukprot:scaffold21401_cov116-Isochrysis_galbana.AAC.1
MPTPRTLSSLANHNLMTIRCVDHYYSALLLVRECVRLPSSLAGPERRPRLRVLRLTRHAPHDLIHALAVRPIVVSVERPVPPLGHDGLVQEGEDVRNVGRDDDEIPGVVHPIHVAALLSRGDLDSPLKDHVELSAGMHVPAA